MRLLAKVCLVAGTMAAAAWTCTRADAQYLGYPLYAGTWVNERLPYFAQHPPVYYKRPVARPYGYSPYAYPPGYVTPERTARRPEYMVINPYVAVEPIASISASQPPAQAVVVKNPFVTP